MSLHVAQVQKTSVNAERRLCWVAASPKCVKTERCFHLWARSSCTTCLCIALFEKQCIHEKVKSVILVGYSESCMSLQWYICILLNSFCLLPKCRAAQAQLQASGVQLGSAKHLACTSTFFAGCLCCTRHYWSPFHFAVWPPSSFSVYHCVPKYLFPEVSTDKINECQEFQSSSLPFASLSAKWD